MLAIYFNILFILEKEIEEQKDNVVMSFLKKIWDEILDLFGDFVDLFKVIKHATYDALAEKYGATGVSILFFLIIIVGIMLIATAIIRK